MAHRRTATMDVRDLLRHMRDNPSDRAVARDTGFDRRTVRRYRTWALAQGFLTDPLPALEVLHTQLAMTLPDPLPPQNASTVEPYRELVTALRDQDVEIRAIWQRLQERGYTGSYPSVHRFVQRLDPRAPDATGRVERAPAEEAQVDFGYAGRLIDPASGLLRRAWAFVMVLSWSRHQFVAFSFDQSVASWLDLHRRAFRFFGGVPACVVIDNLKAAITRACWHDPQVQQAYRECAEHYGFRIGPCRPRTPEHKGKVESGVHYVKRNFLGGRTPTSLPVADADARTWCLTIAGLRSHGTTKAVPLTRFREVEQARLRPLPTSAYDLAVWAKLTLHRDCYVVFDAAYYSAPCRLIGQQLLVRAGTQSVRLYTADYALVATHPRAGAAGERFTHPDHLPPHKLPGLLRTRASCQADADAVGAATAAVVAALLADPILDRLPAAGGVLTLGKRFGAERLEAACARALRFADPSYATVRRILEQQLDQEEPATPPQAAWQ
ncbi:MAG: IS21 family transposase, partial [Burkholderiaceae bacterium]|nr:IS21 family transposase [Burkholderiaceae bacterium]